MTVYVEYVFIDNFTTTYLISKLSYALLRLTDCKGRYVIASAIGTAAAFVYPLMNFNSYILMAVRVVLWLLLSAILFVGKKKFFASALVFLITTFIFGGAMIALGYIVYGNIESALRLPPFNFPYGFCIIGIYSIYKVVKKLIEFTKSRFKIAENKQKFEIQVMDKTLHGEGLMDSGNLLTDNGRPVIILGLKLAGRLLNEEQFAMLALGKGENITYDAHYIESSTLTKKHKILIISNGKIRLYSKDNSNIYITVSIGISLALNNFDAILSPQILNYGEVVK